VVDWLRVVENVREEVVIVDVLIEGTVGLLVGVEVDVWIGEVGTGTGSPMVSTQYDRPTTRLPHPAVKEGFYGSDQYSNSNALLISSHTHRLKSSREMKLSVSIELQVVKVFKSSHQEQYFEASASNGRSGEGLSRAVIVDDLTAVDPRTPPTKTRLDTRDNITVDFVPAMKIDFDQV